MSWKVKKITVVLFNYIAFFICYLSAVALPTLTPSGCSVNTSTVNRTDRLTKTRETLTCTKVTVRRSGKVIKQKPAPNSSLE